MLAPISAEASETSTNCCSSGSVISWRVVAVRIRPMRNEAAGAASYSIHASRRIQTAVERERHAGPAGPSANSQGAAAALVAELELA
jgi:hypothetical protein